MRLVYWSISTIIFLILVYFLVKLTPVYGAVFSFLLKLFAPFIISCLIAFLLYPIIKQLHNWHIPKWLAILVIYLFFFGGTSYLIYRIYPMIIMQLRDLNDQLPVLMRSYSDLIYRVYESTAFLPETVHEKIDQIIYGLEQYVGGVLTAIFDMAANVVDIVIFLTVIPVIVFYLLKDYESIKSYGMNLISEKHRQPVREVLSAMNESLGQYIRGLFFVSLFVSVTTFIAFHLLDIKYALLLAIIMGLTNIIPYFGPIIGAVPALFIAATMSTKVVIALLISLFVIQLIESNLVSPYIMGKSIQIHPIVIIFALLLGGQLGGVIGMIVVVPVLTVLRAIMPPLLKLRHNR